MSSVGFTPWWRQVLAKHLLSWLCIDLWPRPELHHLLRVGTFLPISEAKVAPSWFALLFLEALFHMTCLAPKNMSRFLLVIQEGTDIVRPVLTDGMILEGRNYAQSWLVILHVKMTILINIYANMLIRGLNIADETCQFAKLLDSPLAAFYLILLVWL